MTHMFIYYHIHELVCIYISSIWLQLTVGFAFLPWVAVVKDALGIMRPGHAAEFNPLQYVGQLGQVIGLDEMDGHPVGTTVAQAIRKVFTLL